MLIIAHLSLMITASLCLAAGVGMAMFGRKKKFWLKWHKGFNLAGVGILAAGASMAYANVVLTAGQHLAWFHQWIGLAALILTCLTLFFGFYSFKAVNKPVVRALHRWMGRLSGLTVLTALSLGLIMVGIF